VSLLCRVGLFVVLAMSFVAGPLPTSRNEECSGNRSMLCAPYDLLRMTAYGVATCGRDLGPEIDV
jgi:hypothetical protein